MLELCLCVAFAQPCLFQTNKRIKNTKYKKKLTFKNFSTRSLSTKERIRPQEMCDFFDSDSTLGWWAAYDGVG